MECFKAYAFPLRNRMPIPNSGRLSYNEGYTLGGGLPENVLVYPARMAPQNPTLTGTKFAEPYPYWHKIWAQNPTLCGTEVGQNGTLAILAYAYCRQWECPPGGYKCILHDKGCNYTKVDYSNDSNNHTIDYGIIICAIA